MQKLSYVIIVLAVIVVLVEIFSAATDPRIIDASIGVGFCAACFAADRLERKDPNEYNEE